MTIPSLTFLNQYLPFRVVSAQCAQQSCPPIFLNLTAYIPVIVYTLLSAGVLAFFILLIVYGIIFITSQGDDKKITKAKSRMLFSIIGFSLLFLSFVILQVTNFVGGATVDSLNVDNIGVNVQSTYTPTPIPTTLLDNITDTPIPGDGGQANNTACHDAYTTNGISESAKTIVKAISDNYDVNITGIYTLQQVEQTYDTLCTLYESKTFVHWAFHAGDPGPIGLYFNGVTICPDGAYEHADPQAGLKILGWCEPARNRLLLAHELGHMIAFRNHNLYNTWQSDVYSTQTAEKNNQLPTWNCQFDYGQGPFAAECWADMIGEYITWPYFRETVGGNPQGPPSQDGFLNYNSSTYSIYYKWVANHIFGGVSYANATAPGDNG